MMTKEEVREAIKEAYGNSEYADEIIKALEQEPCEDYISRQALLKLIGEEPFNWTDSDRELQAVEDYRNFRNIVEQLPSVNPQKSKTGNWEQYGNFWEDKFKCSECGKEQPKILCGEQIIGHWSDYCPNCGAKMVEPQETEQALAYADQDTLMSAT